MDTLLRYETANERQLYRALDQLERLQRQRAGDYVPPPVKLGVATDVYSNGLTCRIRPHRVPSLSLISFSWVAGLPSCRREGWARHSEANPSRRADFPRPWVAWACRRAPPRPSCLERGT